MHGRSLCRHTLGSVLALFLLAPVAVAACTAPTDDVVSSDEQNINLSLTKIDPAPLALDGRERLIDYAAPPRFVAYEIHASAGEVLDLYAEARSGGKAAIWLVDARFTNLSVSNDGTNKAHIHCVVPAAAAGKLYLVLRDANERAGKFAIRGTGSLQDPDEDAPCDGICSGDPPPSGAGSLLCEPNKWLRAVPATGKAMMAYGNKAWLFANDGLSWTVIGNETATTQAIPLPAGVTAMKLVKVEIAPSGRPFVTFWNAGQYYAAFFDGTSFQKTTVIGPSLQVAHADAAERIYAVTSNGLTEFDGGQTLIRGALPHTGIGWTVGANGTVHVLHTTSRPSTIHPGDRTYDLFMKSLPHGSLTWSGGVLAHSNEWGFGAMPFVAAPDGSLHLIYGLEYGVMYLRSRTGASWDVEEATDLLSKATLVDPAPASSDSTRIRGSFAHLAAQDYDHASFTLSYASGSAGTPSLYHARRCDPHGGINHETWPVERFSFSGLAGDYGSVAVNERGQPTLVTAAGARQNVLR
jgi:hypothetical protein